MAEERLATGWGADEPIGDSVLRQFVFNQADVLRAMASGPTGRVESDADVVMVDSGGPVAYNNMSLLLRPVTSTDDPVLDRVTDFYAEAPDRLSLLLSVWPLPDLTPRGWQLGGHPMFVVRAPGPVTAPPRAGVEVHPVTTVDDLRTLERVAVEGYPIDEAKDAPPGVAFPDALLERAVSFRLGLVDGAPVSVAALHVAHGVTNLCFAATLPAGRRRGVWSTLVWDRVAEAPDQPAVAFTSDDSRPGFVKLGFLPMTRFTLYVHPPTP
jgi:hypothetical protein